jgi:hypothetical protein
MGWATCLDTPVGRSSLHYAGRIFSQCRSLEWALSLGQRPHIRAAGIGPEDIRDNSIRRRCASICYSATPTQERTVTRLVPGKFYKGRSQEKKPPLRLQLFFLRSPLKMSRICSNLPRHSLGWRALWPSVLGFPVSSFHRFFATKPISSETSKQNVGQMATMVLSGTPGP